MQSRETNNSYFDVAILRTGLLESISSIILAQYRDEALLVDRKEHPKATVVEATIPFKNRLGSNSLPLKSLEDKDGSAKQFEYLDRLQQLIEHSDRLGGRFYALSDLLLKALEDNHLLARRFKHFDCLQQRLLDYSDRLGDCFSTLPESVLLIKALEDNDRSVRHFEYLNCLQQRLLNYNDRLEELCKAATSTAEALNDGITV